MISSFKIPPKTFLHSPKQGDIGDVGEKLKSLCDQEKFCQSFTNVPKILFSRFPSASDQSVPLWFPLRSWVVISNFPNTFFTESRNRLSAGGVKQGVDRFLARFCEIGKRGYLLAAKIGNSFVQRFHQSECYNLLHCFCIF